MRMIVEQEMEQEVPVITKESQFFDTVHQVDDNTEVQVLRRLCREMQDNVEAHVVLSDCLSRQRRYTEGIVVLDRAADLAPLSPVVYRRRGRLAQRCLRFERARADFDYSRDLDPEQAEILFELGVSEYMLAHYAEAKTCLDEALALAEEPEQRCAARYWDVLACSRLGDTAAVEALMADFDEREGKRGESRAYCRGLRLFAGSCDLEAMLRFVKTETDDIDYVTELYAVCVWMESNMRWSEAAAERQKLLARDRDWDCLAYLAAAADGEWHLLKEDN